MLSFIVRKHGLGEQVNVKTIVDAFQTKPYGWDLASIEVLVAYLIGVSKITVTVDSNTLKRSEVAAALRNTQNTPTRSSRLRRPSTTAKSQPSGSSAPTSSTTPMHPKIHWN